MEEGAWGLVTRFESGGPEHPEEVIEVAKVVATLRRHLRVAHRQRRRCSRTRSSTSPFASREEAKIPVHIFHLKIRGKENWGTVGKYLAKIEAARARGLDITANQYPYTAMQHGWSAFFPVWAREDGPAEVRRDAEGSGHRARRSKRTRTFRRGSASTAAGRASCMGRARQPQNKKYEGMRIPQIAKLRGDADPADTCIALMAEEGGTISGMFHTMSEADVRTVMKKPWVAIASDGSAINLNEDGVPHPRSFSTNPRVLGHYVRDERVLTLEDAVRKMTSLPAQILGLRDRGQIREGFAADIVIFNPATVRETTLVREDEVVSRRHSLHDREWRGRDRRRQTHGRAARAAAVRARSEVSLSVRYRRMMVHVVVRLVARVARIYLNGRVADTESLDEHALR